MCILYIYEILYYIISYIISYHIIYFYIVYYILYILCFIFYIIRYMFYVMYYILYYIYDEFMIVTLPTTSGGYISRYIEFDDYLQLTQGSHIVLQFSSYSLDKIYNYTLLDLMVHVSGSIYSRCCDVTGMLGFSGYPDSCIYIYLFTISKLVYNLDNWGYKCDKWG